MNILRLMSIYTFSFALMSLSFTLNAKNLILFIGDGMDEQQITAARIYLYGSEGRTVLDNMAIRSNVQVITVSEEDPEKKIYVADSANSATSIATGVNTSRGRIATSANTDKDIETIVELAQKANIKTGIVTTASITDATPSSFIAHISSRGCENPSRMKQYRDNIVNIIDCEHDTKQKGGKGSIAEQLADSSVDLLFGGGRVHFVEKNEVQDKSVLQEALDKDFAVVDTLDQLLQLIKIKNC